ncbi:MAG: hypothetical protein JOZ51_02865 [Chloroflexi bacterium]|nr:hypothetical protein [Chloroflexota bacterium]
MTSPSFPSARSSRRSVGFPRWLRSRRWRALVLLVALACSLTATSSGQTAGPAYLVKDIAPAVGSYSLRVKELTSAGSNVFFSLDDGITGDELWRSDGTAAGTQRVANINPDEYGSNVQRMVGADGRVFFTAVTRFDNDQLFVSDGTAAGTHALTEFYSSAFDSHAYFHSEFVSIGGQLFFTADDGVHGLQLWRSDGTVAGTTMLTQAPYSEPYALTVSNGMLFFGLWNGFVGELWKLNPATGALTRVYSQIFVNSMLDVDGTLFIVADDLLTGHYDNLELWKSDGTEAGTTLIKDINGTSESSFGEVFDLARINNTVYFAADDGVNGIELWKSDGTAAGTVMVRNIDANTTSSQPANFAVVGNQLVFTADDGVSGRELWKSNGTVAGTVVVKNIHGNGAAFPADINGQPGDVARALLKGVLYFVADDGAHGAELWKTDGTATGTVLVKDFEVGATDGGITEMLVHQGRLYFNANSGLWRTDGTEQGLALIKGRTTHSAWSNPTTIQPVGERAFFVADNGVDGRELWRSDGTEADTKLIKKLFIDEPYFPWTLDVATVNQTLFFASPTSYSHNALWKSDGTEAGTTLVKDISPASTSGLIRNLTEMNGTLFFSAISANLGDGLWKSDGTAAGTVLIKDLMPSQNFEQVMQMEKIDGKLLLNVANNAWKSQLWVSDGTTAGTVMVKDFTLPNSSYGIRTIFPFNGAALFTLSTTGPGEELWKTDGTAAGTVRLKEIYPGSSHRRFWHAVRVNQHMYFTVEHGQRGAQVAELWRTDGTEDGTMMIKQLGTFQHVSPVYQLAELNGALLLVVRDREHGIELWRSDGTAAGTQLLKDIHSGPASSYVELGQKVNGNILLMADDGVRGYELWKTDGTVTGTRLVQDFAPGIDSGAPSSLGVAGSRIFLSADDGQHGRELWALPTSAIGPQFSTYIPLTNN